MIIIQEVLVSDPVVEDQFMCNLSACKGACCWEGDFGAPLEEEEQGILEKIYPIVQDFMTAEGRAAVKGIGPYQYFEEPQDYGTTLLDNGACAYMVYDQKGIAQCSIEQAHRAGVIDFYKPISCHLYPIRILKEEDHNFEAMNYDIWDICSKACELGKKEQMPVYRFVKDAIIRKYGLEFYEQLDATVEHLKNKKDAKG